MSTEQGGDMEEKVPGHRQEKAGPGWSRRGFLAAGGTAAVVLGAARGDVAAGGFTLDGFTTSGGTVTFDVFRALDQMVLRFRFFNMSLVPGVGGLEPSLRPLDTSKPRYLLVDFPKQSIGEQTTLLTGSDASTTYAPPSSSDTANGYRARAFVTAQETRLAFEIPSSITRIRPSLEPSESGTPGLLSWEKFIPRFKGLMRLDELPNSVLPPNELPTTTRAPETAIGAPYGMTLSITANENWTHATKPVTKPVTPAAAKFTELWHTRLTRAIESGPNAGQQGEYPAVTPQIRAVYSDGFDRFEDPEDLNPRAHNVMVPMTDGDRRDIVRLTTDNATRIKPNNAFWEPTPADARSLMLTSGGAWLDLRGSWNPPAEVQGTPPPDGISLSSWVHSSTHGRDQHVVLTYLGYLAPFGNGAVLVKETTRRFELDPKVGYPVANLRTKLYVIVRQQDKFYDEDGSLHLPFEGRGNPFRRIRINTVKTPNLTFGTLKIPTTAPAPALGHEDPRGHDASGVRTLMAQGTEFQFSVTGWDWEGRKVDFLMPMPFITAAAGYDEGDTTRAVTPDADAFGTEVGSMKWIIPAYNASTSRRRIDLRGQRVAVTEHKISGDTTLRFDAMRIKMVPPAGHPANESFQARDQLKGFPAMESGEARIPAVQAISPGSASQVFYDQAHVEHGFIREGSDEPLDMNSLFLRVSGQPLTFEGNETGANPGVITPALNVGALSRNTGLVGGSSNDQGTGAVDQYTQGAMNAGDFFGTAAKILGGIPLSSIIKDSAGISQVPKIDTTTSYPTSGGVADLTKPTLTTRMDWAPVLQNSVDGTFDTRGGAASLRLSAAFVAPSSGKPTTEVSGLISNFRLNLLGSAPVIAIDFNEFSFHSRNGSKPTVKPDIKEVTFTGPLSFVNALQDFLKSPDGANGITVTPTKVVAQAGIALPSIGVGVFSLSNIAFSAAIEIPFTGDPVRVRFGFASPEKPFLIAVAVFGGGGYVLLTVGPDGVEVIDVMFEFGAHIGLHVGPASGSIEVMGGVNLVLGKGEGDSQISKLTGFVKAHGELNFGPVGVAVTFQLSLTWETGASKPTISGKVEVTVEVHVMFISGSVHFEVEKRFVGGGDPNFSQMITDDQFENEYVNAFA